MAGRTTAGERPVVDLYEVLDVTPKATVDEIRAAYRRVLKQVHPDRGGNSALFRLAQQAWETLADPARRAAYDAARTDGPPPDGPGPAARSRRDNTDGASSDPWFGFAEVPFEPAGLSWWDQIDAEAPLVVRPAFGRWQKPLRAVSIGWLAMAAPLVVAAAAQGEWWFAIGLLLVALLAIPPDWRQRVPLHRLLGVGGGGMVILLLLAVVGTPTTDAEQLARIWLGALLAGLAAVRLVARPWAAARAFDSLVREDTALRHNLFGRPGEPLFDGATRLGKAARVEKRYGARLLEPLLWIPGTKLIHGLPWPGRTDRLVDHALVCGRRVALIASVMWPAGRYTLDGYGALLRDGRPFGDGRICFDDAVRAWRDILPNAHVQAFVVVHASTPGGVELAIDGRQSLAFVVASDVHEVIGAWLTAEAGRVDRDVLAKLLTPPPPRWPYNVWAHV